MYVYLIKSKSRPQQRYVGSTSNLKNRLKDHNYGRCNHTTKFKPWRLITAIWIRNKKQALALEKYLKTGSGRAFAKRHFWD